jgi:hypothetical protein
MIKTPIPTDQTQINADVYSGDNPDQRKLAYQ